jgi:hypothetical protein
MVRLEGLGALKQINDPIGSRTRNLPAYSIEPQYFLIPFYLQAVQIHSANGVQLLEA